MPNNLLEKYDLTKFQYRINWEITNICNFRCNYCINPQTESKNKERNFTADEILRFFDSTKKQWLILITGGEPFMYPNFTEVCQALTQTHSLQITTNLSSPNIYQFADSINPSKIFILSASYHYTERNRLGQTDDFISKCKYLKGKGFPVLVNYVAHPDTMDRMESDLMMFTDLGIETFVLLLRGKVNNKIYPDAYTKKEFEMIEKYLLDVDTERKAAFNNLNFYSHFCDAGKSYLFMDSLGNISRCSTIQNRFGNLFDNNFHLNENAEPCTVKNCNDVYCGLAAVKDKKASKFKMWLSRKL